MKIRGPATAPMHVVYRNCPATIGASWPAMFDALWRAALTHGIDPVVLVAQSAHETGWGTFTGNVPKEFYNPAGLKVRDPNFVGSTSLASGGTDLRDTTLAHAQFASWPAGCAAQAQHLNAYAGMLTLMGGLPLLAPRRVHIESKYQGVNALVDVEQLGGKWAPSLDYGNRIAAVAVRLVGG